LRSKSQVGQQTIQGFPITLVPDGRGNLFSAGSFNVKNKSLKNVTIIQRRPNGIATRRITAAKATWNAKKSGWNLLQAKATSPQSGELHQNKNISDSTSPASKNPSGSHQTSIDFFKTD